VLVVPDPKAPPNFLILLFSCYFLMNNSIGLSF
jgi:hypothetical protein